MPDKVYLDDQGNPIASGLLTPGNIDLHNRPRVKNADGSISTVRSISVNMDGREVLIPTVSDDGRVLSNDDAIRQFKQTGKHLGMFDSPAHATAYAQQLHNDQAREYTDQPSGKVYLDDHGNPIQSAAAPKPSLVDAVLADNPALPPLMRGGQAVLRLAKAHPATTGAVVGGAIAAPFTGGMSALPAMAISGGAGALGAGAGQLASGQKPDLGTMATEGAGMATGEGLGRGAVALLSKAGPILGKAVLRASPTLQREFPNLVETFLKERIPVGQSAEAGVRIKGSAATARQMAADADAAGAAPVGPRDIVKEFRGVRDEVANRAANARPGAGDEMQEIVTRAKGLRLAGPQSVARNQVLKQSAQADATNAFRAADRGAPINDVTAKLDKAVAIGRQKAAEARVPGIADVNKRTQNLMGLEGALETAERKSASPLGFNPVNWGGAMAPGATSHIAFGVDSASRAPIPGALRALLALLAGEDPNSPH